MTTSESHVRGFHINNIRIYATYKKKKRERKKIRMKRNKKEKQSEISSLSTECKYVKHTVNQLEFYAASKNLHADLKISSGTKTGKFHTHFHGIRIDVTIKVEYNK